MKKNYILLVSLFLLSVCLQGTAQMFPGNLYGKATIGTESTPRVLMNGELSIKSEGELHMGTYVPGMQTNELYITGNYIGGEGSIYMSVTNNSNEAGSRAFIDIEGTATRSGGATQIVLDMFADNGGWDGTQIELIRANKTGSDVQTFTMAPQSLENGRTAALLYRFDGESVIWYIGEQNSDVCLDLIVQKRNHTLIVNNNAETNGGHTFVEYTWFKDGVEILAENTLGYYYTQLDNDADSLLDTQAQYYARMTDSEGTVYNTCPYTPTMLTDFTIKVYPNPVQVQKEVSVDLEGLDWKTTTITVYDSDGRLVLKQSAQGDKTRVVMPRTVGVYMVKIQSGGMLKYTNIVVM